jgi:hypothetical protein
MIVGFSAPIESAIAVYEMPEVMGRNSGISQAIHRNRQEIWQVVPKRLAIQPAVS